MFLRAFSRDLAIDLGTANTLVFVRGEGVVIREPSIVAVDETDRSVIAVGNEAKAMLGKTPPHIRVVQPLKEGVIADFEITERMLSYLIAKTQRWLRTVLKPRVVIGVPSGITQVERRAVRDSAKNAGAHDVYLVEEPVAAAIGAGLPVQDPGGNLIVDVGGGTTEVAVISLAGVIFCTSVRVAGDEMDEAILQHVRKQYNLLIGARQAEELKITLGSACPGESGEASSMEIKGRDLTDGIPKTIVLSEEEVREALRVCVTTIIETVRTCLERTPPELAADIVDSGIVLSGGGGLLRGFDRLLSQETKLPVKIAADPTSCVVLGLGRALDELDLLKRVAGPA
jgi:rod shape-determining protein MreB